jgi:hypothetical protein
MIDGFTDLAPMGIPAPVVAVRRPPNPGQTYEVRIIVEGSPFRYQFIARDSTHAMICAKELVPTGKIVSVSQGGQW